MRDIYTKQNVPDEKIAPVLQWFPHLSEKTDFFLSFPQLLTSVLIFFITTEFSVRPDSINMSMSSKPQILWKWTKTKLIHHSEGWEWENCYHWVATIISFGCQVGSWLFHDNVKWKWAKSWKRWISQCFSMLTSWKFWKTDVKLSPVLMFFLWDHTKRQYTWFRLSEDLFQANEWMR